MCEVSRSYNVCIERLEEIFRFEVESLVICEVLYEVSPLVTELKEKPSDVPPTYASLND